MDWRHLWGKNGIVLSHFLSKGHLRDGTGADRTLLVQLFPDTDRREQGSDTDSGSAEVIYLINFQTGINLI